MPDYETTPEIEIRVARWFDTRRNLIVPNVWWGMGFNHELDLCVLTKSGYAYEVEIKVSRSDLLRERKKYHGHGSSRIRRLYFAVPEKLRPSLSEIPESAGILIVNREGHVKKEREAKPNALAKKLDDQERLKLAELGTLRIWDLKQKVLNQVQKQFRLPLGDES